MIFYKKYLSKHERHVQHSPIHISFFYKRIIKNTIKTKEPGIEPGSIYYLCKINIASQSYVVHHL